LGPFFVAIDAEGNNYFTDLAEEVEAKMPVINQKLAIPTNYDYTEVNAAVVK
jgi:hypothetical protein